MMTEPTPRVDGAPTSRPAAADAAPGAAPGAAADARAPARAAGPSPIAPEEALAAPPPSIVDDAGEPILGRFRGPIPCWNPEALRLGALERRVREKRWHYVGLVSPRLHAAVAIFSSGYISAFLLTLHDREDGLSGASMVKGAARLPVFFAGGLAGGTASFQSGDHSFCVQRVSEGGERLHVVAHAIVGARPAVVDLDLDLAPARHVPLALTGRLGEGFLHTHKVAAVPLAGHVRWGDRAYRIEAASGFGHVDATIGCPARRTFWNWCSAAGHSACGRRVGVNLSSLFGPDGARGRGADGRPAERGAGAPAPDENAVWLDGVPVLVGECHFEYDPARPAEPWTVVAADGRLRLRLEPRDVRQERTELGLVRSRFIQPVGPLSGRLDLAGGARVELPALFGVMEEHDAVW